MNSVYMSQTDADNIQPAAAADQQSNEGTPTMTYISCCLTLHVSHWHKLHTVDIKCRALTMCGAQTVVMGPHPGNPTRTPIWAAMKRQTLLLQSSTL